MKEVSVVIGVHNNLPYTEKCLDSIRDTKNEESVVKEIIIVENGSSDRTREWLEQEKKNRSNWKILLFDEALGYARAYNRGIQQAACDYIVLLNNDTEVKDKWLDLLCSYSEVDRVKIAGPVMSAGFIHGFCWIIKKENFHRYGLFDESYGLAYCEDNDFQNRVSADSGLFYAPIKDINLSEKNMTELNWPIIHHLEKTTQLFPDIEKIREGNKWKYWHTLNKELHNIYIIIPKTKNYLLQQLDHIKNTNTNHFVCVTVINNKELYEEVNDIVFFQQRNFHYFPTLSFTNSLEECLLMGKLAFPNYNDRCIVYIEQ